MSRSSLTPEQYAELGNLWRRYLVELRFKSELKKDDQTTRETISYLEESGEAGILENDVVSALHLFQSVPRHTREWWEWLTVLDGSMKARFVCMCLTNDAYHEKRRVVAFAIERAFADDENTD